jgi:Domain of unknown function (DUF5666)
MNRRSFIGATLLAVALAGGAGATYAAQQQASTSTIAAHGPRNGVGGAITSVSGTSIVVAGREGSKTIATTASTTFELDGASATLAAMKAGLFVHAEGTTASDGSFTATAVRASTTQPTPPQGGRGPRP